MQEVPDDLQETPDNPQEEVNDLQGNSQVRQVDFKMTEYSRRDLSFDEEANTHLLEHFCTRGTSEKDPTKPGKTALFQLLLKYMVASGKLVIDRIEDGVPILSRGNAHAHAVAHVTAITQETDRTLGVTVPISAEPWADPLAARARGGETCQDGVGEGDQDCAGEDAGSGAGGREVQARGNCRFQKDQESRTLTGLRWRSWRSSLHDQSCAGARNAAGFPARRRSLAFPTRTLTTWSSARTRRTCPWPPGTGVPVLPVAGEEEVSQASTCRTTCTCKKLGRGTTGARQAPTNRNQKTGKPRQAGKGNGTQKQQQQQ
jgi:hypothetical protein